MAKDLHRTLHDLPEGTRVKIIAILHGRLADFVDLQSQLRQAHWSVRGPQFIAYHELFGELYEGLGEPIDDLAERIGQLGGKVRGTLRASAARTTLAEYPLEAVDGAAHLQATAKAIAHVAKAVRADIDATSQLGDAITADLLTELGGMLDKNLWLVEAHRQGR
ncbi:MAG: DNA starvation/stationary phase protection protein Dps [Phycisphaerales bacterium]|jgi:starvation-inducible DNA-binding protein|nr:DNA starvation/stationary phase protection protein Dps [Phycisphaerales bacterium]